MSYVLVDQVFFLEMPNPAKLVLLAMAQHANNDGSKANPSEKRIARMLGISPSSVRRGLVYLQANGLIVPVRYGRGGKACTTEYQLHLDTWSQWPRMARSNLVTVNANVVKVDVIRSHPDVIRSHPDQGICSDSVT